VAFYVALALTVAPSLASSGCTDEYCQTGPKYGTQCFTVQRSADGPPAPPTQSGSVYALASNRRGPNGQKP
jgi:hypothetical protein